MRRRSPDPGKFTQLFPKKGQTAVIGNQSFAVNNVNAMIASVSTPIDQPVTCAYQLAQDCHLCEEPLTGSVVLFAERVEGTPKTSVLKFVHQACADERRPKWR